MERGVGVKICGLCDAATADAVCGARYAGFVFYPRSPRFVRAAEAAAVALRLPVGVLRVGVFVDSGDDVMSHICEHVRLDMIQLHGEESPSRCGAVRRVFGVPVMKALGVASEVDVARARSYAGAVDMMLFDARPSVSDALPGGRGVAFDWTLLQERAPACPWMLSGGLDADNVARAVAQSGARLVDVSSGVESSPGQKDRERMRAFIKAAASIASPPPE